MASGLTREDLDQLESVGVLGGGESLTDDDGLVGAMDAQPTYQIGGPLSLESEQGFASEDILLDSMDAGTTYNVGQPAVESIIVADKVARDSSDDDEGFWSQFYGSLESTIFESNPRLSGLAIEGLGRVSGSDSMKEFGKNIVAEFDASPPEEKFIPRVSTYKDVDGLNSLLDYVGSSVGQGVGSMAMTIAGAGAGAVGGAVVGGTGGLSAGGVGAIPGAIAGVPTGAAAGAVGASFLLNYGDTYEYLVSQEGMEPNDAANYALVPGTIMAGLDAFAVGKILGPAKRNIAGSLIKRTGQLAARGAGTEGVTEAAQQVIQEFSGELAEMTGHASEDITFGQRLENVVNSMIAGWLSGGVIGGVTAPVQKPTEAPAPVVPEFEDLTVPELEQWESETEALISEAEAASEVAPEVELEPEVEVEAVSEAERAHAAIIQKYESDEEGRIPTIKAATRIITLERRLRDGEISQEQFEKSLSKLAAELSAVSMLKEEKRYDTSRDRETGPDIVREKLLAARRRGEIDPEMTEMALWLLDQNPSIASSLAISLRKTPDKRAPGKLATSGQYHANPVGGLMRIFKTGAGNETTAVHEMLHHTERMMPEDVRQGISEAYLSALSKEMDGASDINLAYLKYLAGEESVDPTTNKKIDQEGLATAIANGRIPIDYYQYFNPSEFWAVNATRILDGRYQVRGTWVGKAKQYLIELIQKAKSIFGLQSDAPILRGLKSVLDGDGTIISKSMLASGTEFFGDIDDAIDGLPDKIGVQGLEGILGRKRHRKAGQVAEYTQDVKDKDTGKIIHKKGDKKLTSPKDPSVEREEIIYPEFTYTKIGAGEWESLRLDEFILAAKASGQKSVSKEALIRHVEENKVEIGEVHLGGGRGSIEMRLANKSADAAFDEAEPLIRDFLRKRKMLRDQKWVGSFIEDEKRFMAPEEIDELVSEDIHRVYADPGIIFDYVWDFGVVAGRLNSAADPSIPLPFQMRQIQDRVREIRSVDMSKGLAQDILDDLPRMYQEVVAFGNDKEYKEILRKAREYHERFKGQPGFMPVPVVLQSDGLNMLLAELKELKDVPERYRETVQLADTPEFQKWVDSRKKAEELYAAASKPIYEKYTLPGGDNYQEIVLTGTNKYRKILNDPDIRTLRGWTPDEIDIEGNPLFRSHAVVKALEAVHKRYGITPSADTSNPYPFQDSLQYLVTSAGKSFEDSHHPDVLDVIVHTRLTDRIDTKGRKILFVEEVQSDWNQEGRKRGYSQEENADLILGWQKQLNEIASMSRELSKRRGDQVTLEQRQALVVFRKTGVEPESGSKLFHEPPFSRSDEARQLRIEQKALRDKRIKIEDKIDYATDGGPVPDTVFKRTQEWVGLAVRRILLEAAEAGYDGVAFTNGKDVQSVSGGEIEGQQKFYDEILPSIVKKESNGKLGKTEISIDEGDDYAYLVARGMEGIAPTPGGQAGGVKEFNFLELTPDVKERAMKPQRLFAKTDDAPAADAAKPAAVAAPDDPRILRQDPIQVVRELTDEAQAESIEKLRSLIKDLPEDSKQAYEDFRDRQREVFDKHFTGFASVGTPGWGVPSIWLPKGERASEYPNIYNNEGVEQETLENVASGYASPEQYRLIKYVIDNPDVLDKYYEANPDSTTFRVQLSLMTTDFVELVIDAQKDAQKFGISGVTIDDIYSGRFAEMLREAGESSLTQRWTSKRVRKHFQEAQKKLDDAGIDYKIRIEPPTRVMLVRQLVRDYAYELANASAVGGPMPPMPNLDIFTKDKSSLPRKGSGYETFGAGSASEFSRSAIEGDLSITLDVLFEGVQEEPRQPAMGVSKPDDIAEFVKSPAGSPLKWYERVAEGQRGAAKVLRETGKTQEKLAKAWQTDSGIATIRDFEYDIIKEFVSMVGPKRLEKIAFAIEPEIKTGMMLNEPLGLYFFGKDIVGISHSAIASGRFVDTTIHELWHGLSQYLPDNTVNDLYAQFARERNQFMQDNPEAFDRSGNLADISMAKNQSTYRFSSFDEWVVEKMKDLSIEDASTRLLEQDEATRYSDAPAGKPWERALRALAELVRSHYNQIKKIFGRDVARKTYTDFMQGKYMEQVRSTPLADVIEITSEDEARAAAKWSEYLDALDADEDVEAAAGRMSEETERFIEHMVNGPKQVVSEEEFQGMLASQPPSKKKISKPASAAVAITEVPNEFKGKTPRLQAIIDSDRYVVVNKGTDRDRTHFDYTTKGTENWPDSSAYVVDTKTGKKLDRKDSTESRYNPRIIEVTPYLSLDFEDGRQRFRYKITRKEGWLESLPQDDSLMYRGMSWEEWQYIQKTGKIRSSGEYNLGPEQVGLTYFSSDVDSARFYADAFAPVQFKATPDKPAVVIAVKKRPGVEVKGTGEHEIGITDDISSDDIVSVWEGHVGQVSAGKTDVISDFHGIRDGSGMGASNVIFWKEGSTVAKPTAAQPVSGLSEFERAQLGTPKKGSLKGFEYISEENWPILREMMVRKRAGRKSYKQTETFGPLDPELTAYTPGETLKLLSHPKIVSWHNKVSNYKIPEEYKTVVLVPCATSKPWGAAACGGDYYPAYNKILKEVESGEIPGPVFFATISEPLGIVPMDMWDEFPAYDNPGLFEDGPLRSGMSTKDWNASQFGQKYMLPFDQEAKDKSIDILGDVVANFVENNQSPDRQFMSFVDAKDMKSTTHSLMLNRAEKTLDREIVSPSVRFGKTSDVPRARWQHTYEHIRSILSQPAAPAVAPVAESDDYRLSHQPAKGPSGDQIGTTDDFPTDILQHPEWYTGFPKEAKKFWPKIVAGSGNPDAKITIYRAMPKGAGSTIENGNWVTPSKAYAEDHAEGEKDWHVVAVEVPLRDINWAGDDLMEWGYWGPNTKPTAAAKTVDELPEYDPTTRGTYDPETRKWSWKPLPPRVKAYHFGSKPPSEEWNPRGSAFRSGEGSSSGMRGVPFPLGQGTYFSTRDASAYRKYGGKTPTGYEVEIDTTNMVTNNIYPTPAWNRLKDVMEKHFPLPERLPDESDRAYSWRTRRMRPGGPQSLFKKVSRARAYELLDEAGVTGMYTQPNSQMDEIVVFDGSVIKTRKAETFVDDDDLLQSSMRE